MSFLMPNFQKRYHHPFQNGGYKNTISEQVIEILKSNTNETVLFLSWKYNYSNRTNDNTSFNQIRLQTGEILMLKAAKT